MKSVRLFGCKSLACNFPFNCLFRSSDKLHCHADKRRGQLFELCCFEIVSVLHAPNNHTEKSLQELLLTKLSKIYVLTLLSCISLQFLLQWTRSTEVTHWIMLVRFVTIQSYFKGVRTVQTISPSYWVLTFNSCNLKRC